MNVGHLLNPHLTRFPLYSSKTGCEGALEQKGSDLCLADHSDAMSCHRAEIE